MNVKKKPVVGIDVSCETFNVYWDGNDKEYANNSGGFRKLLKESPPDALYSMEATGNYHYKLASFLYSKGLDVKVFNPLRVNRWIEATRGKGAKTDKLNARDLLNFACTSEFKDSPLWEPYSPKHARARVIVSLLRGLSKLANSAFSMNHAVGFVLSRSDGLLRAMDNVVFSCVEQKKVLEKELFSLARELWPEKFRLLKTIPGIGNMAASVLLVVTKGMDSFPTREKLVQYLGLAPSVRESGTSVRGNGKITKVGNPYMRKLLYMCAMVAARWCKPCKELYERLTAKGKKAKLAQVAVMHRLAKIAFGVVKSGEPYRGGKVFAASHSLFGSR